MSDILKLEVIEKENELEKLLKQYDSKFEEPFPRYYLRNWDEDLLCEEIRECLKTGEPFNPYKGMEDEDALF